MTQTAPTTSTGSPALDRALAEIISAGAKRREAAKRDASRETTITLGWTHFGEPIRIEVTGIAPFEAVESVGPLSGLPIWTVKGQAYEADGLRNTRIQNVHGVMHGQPGSFSKEKAIELADRLNAAAGTRKAARVEAFA